MKPIIILALLSLAACRQRHVPETQQAETIATPAPVTEIIPPLAPEPVAAVVTPEPPVEYFLAVRKSIETDSGFVGIEPGTKLERTADGYAANGVPLELTESEVTTTRPVIAPRPAYRPRMATPIPATPQPIAASTAPPRMPGSSLDRGAYDKREGVAKPPVLLDQYGGRIKMKK